MGIFSKPHPLIREKSSKWQSVIFIGVFVFLFLLIFQPFGLASIPSNKIPVLLGYGFITSAIVWLFNFPIQKLFPGHFDERSWKLFNELIYSSAIVFSIAAANWYYTTILGFLENSFQSFLSAMLWTFSLGVFPVVFGIMLAHYFKLKRNLKEAKEILSFKNQNNQQIAQDSDERRIVILDVNGVEVLELNAAKIIRIEAAGNYVVLHYFYQEIPEKILVRNSLKKLLGQLSQSTQVIQTHRSHAVNVDFIENVNGNAQGLMISLKGIKEVIPVSRSFIATLKGVT